tara:strand:- start:170 stop:364 length:195 start_codon:yes stop_codon:yes gene_type:complete
MEYSNYREGQRVKITENIYTVDGTLYKGSIVKINEMGPFPDKDVRIVDDVGKIWYLDFMDIEKI